MNGMVVAGAEVVLDTVPGKLLEYSPALSVVFVGLTFSLLLLAIDILPLLPLLLLLLENLPERMLSVL